MSPVELWCRLSIATADGAELGPVEVRGPGAPDLALVEALARLQLLAGRAGATLRVRDACADLVGLLELTGLRREVGGQSEERVERLGVEEGVEGADPTV